MLPDGGLRSSDDEPVKGFLRGILSCCSLSELDKCATLQKKIFEDKFHFFINVEISDAFLCDS
jgi:hypothetical protein